MRSKSSHSGLTQMAKDVNGPRSNRRTPNLIDKKVLEDNPMVPAATANQDPQPGTRPQISGITSSFQSGFATPLAVAVVLLAVLLGFGSAPTGMVIAVPGRAP
jgi:hypothetical protein